MDLISIAKTLWRHKLVTVPIMALIFVGAVYVVVLKAPVYQADASYILINPPNPPTAAQLARDPSLGRLNSNNQLVGYGNLSIIVDLLAEDLSTGADRQLLMARGANPEYTIAPNSTYLSAPIIDIVGVGPTPNAAIATAKLVGEGMVNRLNTIQAQQGTSRQYWITAQPLQTPNQAQAQLSSKLRGLIGVLGAGMIILFVAVSMLNGAAERRRLKNGGTSPDGERSETDWVRDMNQMYGSHGQAAYGLSPQDYTQPPQSNGHPAHRYGHAPDAFYNEPMLSDETPLPAPKESLGSFSRDLGASRPS